LVSAALRFLENHNWKFSLTELSEAHSFKDSDESVFSTLALKEISSLIQSLPLGYKLVFNLYAIEGYSHKEIAEKLNVSVNTSKSQLFKARKLLKQLIESQLKISRYE